MSDEIVTDYIAIFNGESIVLALIDSYRGDQYNEAVYPLFQSVSLFICWLSCF